MRIEVVYATSSRQELVELEVEAPLPVANAIRLSGIEERFAAEDLSTCDVGIWGRVVTRETIATDGDRIEIYRHLERDPREARRLRADMQDGRSRDD